MQLRLTLAAHQHSPKTGIDDSTGAIYVLNVVRGRWTPAEVETWLKGAGIHDGARCIIRLPQDPGQAGKLQAQYCVSKMLQGFDVWTEREEGSKPYRANPFAAQCEHGMVRLVQGDSLVDRGLKAPRP